MNLKNKIRIVSGIIFIVFFFMGCNNDYIPKPRGYFRIDLPEKSYRVLDTTFPYSFEYPDYAEIIPDELSPHEPYWINLDFPGFNGRIHISYKEVNNNLITYFEDARTMVVKHIPKASAIEDELIFSPESDIFGLKYMIKGIGAASPCQFFLTDSSRHFVRGALYFNMIPNNDSLAPVIDFINEDIDHLIDTFRWN